MEKFTNGYLAPARLRLRHVIGGLFRGWAEVSFTPQAWDIRDGGKRMRAVPFESFVRVVDILLLWDSTANRR